MTLRTTKIEDLRKGFAELQAKKLQLTKEIWEIEFKIEKIKEQLMKYERVSRMAERKAEMGEDCSEYPDGCIDCNSGHGGCKFLPSVPPGRTE